MITVAGILCTAPLVLVAQQAAPAAAPGSYSIHLEPSRTSISFSAGTLRHVHGTFAMQGGIFGLDTSSGVAQGEILIDASSEKSNDAGLDKKIRGATLDVEKFPTILFDPQKITGRLPAQDGQVHLSVAGTLTIHGQDHPLTLDVLTTLSGPQVEFHTAFTVPYVAWGMKDASIFLMHDRTIRVTVDTHGVVEGTTTQK